MQITFNIQKVVEESGRGDPHVHLLISSTVRNGDSIELGTLVSDMSATVERHFSDRARHEVVQTEVTGVDGADAVIESLFITQ